MSTLSVVPKPKDWFFRIKRREAPHVALARIRLVMLEQLVPQADWDLKADMCAEMLDLQMTIQMSEFINGKDVS
jgi:hypothetical protein